MQPLRYLERQIFLGDRKDRRYRGPGAMSSAEGGKPGQTLEEDEKCAVYG